MAHNQRTHNRVVVAIHARWTIEDSSLAGKAKVLDVSLHGASFQIDQRLPLDRPVAFGLCAHDVPMLPGIAELRWSHQPPTLPNITLVGVEFQKITPEWTRWVLLAGARPEMQPSDLLSNSPIDLRHAQPRPQEI